MALLLRLIHKSLSPAQCPFIKWFACQPSNKLEFRAVAQKPIRFYEGHQKPKA